MSWETLLLHATQPLHWNKDQLGALLDSLANQIQGLTFAFQFLSAWRADENLHPLNHGNRVKHAAEAESSASQGAGLLELWCGAGQVVWHHAGMCRLSAASGQLGAEFPATLARMVL